jgi:hypothetical protein
MADVLATFAEFERNRIGRPAWHVKGLFVGVVAAEGQP